MKKLLLLGIAITFILGLSQGAAAYGLGQSYGNHWGPHTYNYGAYSPGYWASGYAAYDAFPAQWTGHYHNYRGHFSQGLHPTTYSRNTFGGVYYPHHRHGAPTTGRYIPTYKHHMYYS